MVRLLTVRDCPRVDRRAKPPICRQVPISRHIVRAAPERLFCLADACQYSSPDPTCSQGNGCVASGERYERALAGVSDNGPLSLHAAPSHLIRTLSPKGESGSQGERLWLSW